MASMRQSISQVTGVHRSIDGSLELLGIEPLEEHARSLAALLTVAVKGRVRHQPHLERLDGHMQALRNVYVDLSEDVRLRRAIVAGRRMAARQLPYHLRGGA